MKVVRERLVVRFKIQEGKPDSSMELMSDRIPEIHFLSTVNHLHLIFIYGAYLGSYVLASYGEPYR